MNTGIVTDCIILAGCAIFGFVPFDKKRVRADWAKMAFGIIAVIGIARELIELAWDFGWFTLGSEAGRRLDDYLYMVSGVILGFLFSLVLSGQLSGTKRDL